jgi:uroporphyrinogen-III synthase
LGLTVAVTPQEYVAESLVEVLGEQVDGKRVLLARAALARDVIPDALRARGATVDVVEAYRTVIPAESVTAIRTLLGLGGCAPDAATFTSSSTVTHFLNLLREAGVEAQRGMRGGVDRADHEPDFAGKTDGSRRRRPIRMIWRGWWRR